jgi:hypothetical protein
MGNILSLAALIALAQPVFKANPKADKVFATSDGNIFLPDAHNAARNHGRQEKLEVHEISRTGATSDDILDHIQTDAKANELKHEQDAAEAAVNAAKSNPVPATGEAVPVEAAAAAQAAGKTEAVEESTKANDAPAAESGVVVTAVAKKPAAAKKPATKPAAAKAKLAAKGEAAKAEGTEADAGASN